MNRILSFLAIMTLTASPAVHGQGRCPSDVLTAEDGGEHDEFGYAVSVSGDAVLVGAWHDDNEGVDLGSAYVFRKVDGHWRQEAKLVAENGGPWGDFGSSVSLSGDVALIGAPGYGPRHVGAAYVFRRVEGAWVQEAKLLPDDGVPHLEFGSAVCIEGDIALVGEPRHHQAFVFRRVNDAWIQEAKLLPDGGGLYFGCSVSLSEGRALIGAKFYTENNEQFGAAYVFRYDAAWILEAKLLADDRENVFGQSVSLLGDAALIGSRRYAYSFRKTGDLWAQEAKIVPHDGANYFGESVSLSADVALIGARSSDYDVWSGAAYVFHRVDGAWEEQAKLLPRDASKYASFGHSVALLGDTAVVGMHRGDERAEDAGSVQLYQLDELGSACSGNETLKVECEFSNAFHIISATVKEGIDCTAVDFRLDDGTIAPRGTSNSRAGYKWYGVGSGDHVVEAGLPCGDVLESQVICETQDLCEYQLKKRTKSRKCGYCPDEGEHILSETSCQDAGDCPRKIKGLIPCPDGGRGVCKRIQGKRVGCG